MKNKDNILLGEAYDAVSDPKLGALKSAHKSFTTDYSGQSEKFWEMFRDSMDGMKKLLDSSDYQEWFHHIGEEEHGDEGQSYEFEDYKEFARAAIHELQKSLLQR